MNSQSLIGPIQLFRASWSFYKNHWKTLTTLVIIPFGGMFIGNLVAAIGAGFSQSSPTTAMIVSILGVLITLAAAVFMIAAVLGLIHVLHKLTHESGHAVHVWSQYKIGFRYFWPVILVGIMRSLGTLGASMIFLIPGIMFSIYSFFVPFSVVVDDKKGTDAFADSFALVYKRWWKVLGRLLFLGICYIPAVFIITGIAYIPRLVFGYGMNSVPHSIVSNVLMTVLMLVFLPFATTYVYRLFNALKTTRVEGGRTETFKQFFITFMVIGGLLIVGSIVFRSLSDAGQPKRAPYNSDLAVTAPHTPHGNLV